MAAPITHFELDPDRLAVIAQCTENLDIGDGSAAEWPNNILSRRTVVYGSGQIARTGEEVTHAVDPDELELCRRLSSEVANLMVGAPVPFSETDDEFQAFFIAGNIGAAVAGAISEAMILERFGGTIFPGAAVTVEPLAEQGVWWSEVESDGGDLEDADNYLAPLRRMIDWFKGRSEFVDTAYVRIGSDDLLNVAEDTWPEGTEMTGSVMPRLALGLTRGGSLVGLFGVSVQTTVTPTAWNAWTAKNG